MLLIHVQMLRLILFLGIWMDCNENHLAIITFLGLKLISIMSVGFEYIIKEAKWNYWESVPKQINT